MGDLTSFISDYWHLAIVGALLLGISFDFLRRFVVPGAHLSKELKDSSERLLTLVRLCRRRDDEFGQSRIVSIMPSIVS